MPTFAVKNVYEQASIVDDDSNDTHESEDFAMPFIEHGHGETSLTFGTRCLLLILMCLND